MNYQEVLEYIEHNLRGGCNPGLNRIQNLLELLGNPHKDIKAVHIAGTNGKGSTTAMLSSILREAGYKVGTYISPHLITITERYLINGIRIDEETFAKYFSIIKNAIEQMKTDGLEIPTEFEALTALAFLYFKDMNIDIGVIEVGLGGRYDATNVLNSIMSIITSISHDHMNVLGESIEKISYEKAGIIKRDQITILYPQRYKEAEEVIEKVCKEKNSICVKVSEENVVQKGFGLEGQKIDYLFNGKIYKNIMLPLLGDHQLLNAAVAISAAVKLNELGFTLSEDSIRKGIGKVVWPGRLSIISKEPFIVIDGAHNKDGVYALSKAVKKYFKDKDIVILMGMLKDKDHKESISILGPMAKQIVITEPNSERALSAEELAEEAREFCQEVYAMPNISEALEKALNIAGNHSIILICGSLYLIGEIYGKIKRR
ncbi:MAG: bifunctional folylpolyglutamate synthase/dihydrofolate synthase [Clostridiales bacterium]|nr:bifunctional folylpolyglutamate synthase/dihydrofolate synthase [Clostridiales bacterium]